jgi:hypothetical protein
MIKRGRPRAYGVEAVTFFELLIPFLVFGFQGRFECLGRKILDAERIDGSAGDVRGFGAADVQQRIHNDRHILARYIGEELTVAAVVHLALQSFDSEDDGITYR